MTDEFILDYATEPTRVRLVKKTKRHWYVMNVLTQTVYKVHKSRVTFPDNRGQTGRVMAALQRGETVTPENLYHV